MCVDRIQTRIKSESIKSESDPNVVTSESSESRIESRVNQVSPFLNQDSKVLPFGESSPESSRVSRPSQWIESWIESSESSPSVWLLDDTKQEIRISFALFIDLSCGNGKNETYKIK